MICLSLILHVLLSLPVEEKAEGGWLRWLVLCPERCGPSPSNSMTRCSNKEESNPYHILHTSKKNESPPAPEVGSVHFQTHAVVDLVVCQCNVVFVDIIPERRYESYIWKEMDMV